eukprot:TRINITY_DN23778_c0_g1_i1.p1 TRINITY_DN23778_c0_g1~~TRINITY_DN23778_c0_g1_i1.p1  ORF type:complete len:316 (+),score=76.72 TRINITY_DN23778_c0_g1_i1:91-948(+)
MSSSAKGVVTLAAGIATGVALSVLWRRLQQTFRVWNVKFNGKDIPVIAEDTVADKLVENALACVPFRNWLAKLEKNRDSFTLHKVLIQSVDMFGPKRVGFVKLKAEVTDRDGDPLAGICFLRGGSVAVLVILTCEQTGEEHCLQVQIDNVCAVQPRGMALPAGMLDGNGDFSGAMAREMEEETGIKCDAAGLIDMTELAYGNTYEGMYPSVGACDEFVRLFLYQKKMRQEDIKALEGKLMGLKEENEKIKLCLVPLNQLWHLSSDSKALSALFLYSKLKECGKLS